MIEKIIKNMKWKKKSLLILIIIVNLCFKKETYESK
jgi:hypothetical protein